LDEGNLLARSFTNLIGPAKTKKTIAQPKLLSPGFDSASLPPVQMEFIAKKTVKTLECEREEEAYQMMKINLTSLLGFAIGLMACFTPRLLRLKHKKPIICHSIAC